MPKATKPQVVLNQQLRKQRATLCRIAAHGSSRVQTARRSLRCAAAVEEVAQEAAPVEQLHAPSPPHLDRPAESESAVGPHDLLFRPAQGALGSTSHPCGTVAGDASTQEEPSSSASNTEGEQGHSEHQGTFERSGRGRGGMQGRGGARGGGGSTSGGKRGDRGFELAKQVRHVPSLCHTVAGELPDGCACAPEGAALGGLHASIVMRLPRGELLCARCFASEQGMGTDDTGHAMPVHAAGIWHVVLLGHCFSIRRLTQ